MLYDLLNSIEKQTRLPDKVVVSCSSTENFVNKINYSFNLEIICTNDKLNAAQNRNIAISHLQEMDYITLIDADDIMHPQRIESLLYIFQEHDVDIILHNFTFDYNFTLFENINVRINSLEQCHSCCIKHIDFLKYKNEHIHHSQVSIKRKITDIVKFPEESKYHTREDCVFCHRVFGLENIKNAYISNILSYYRPSNTGGYK
jgi:hypothetical protein